MQNISLTMFFFWCYSILLGVNGHNILPVFFLSLVQNCHIRVWCLKMLLWCQEMVFISNPVITFLEINSARSSNEERPSNRALSRPFVLAFCTGNKNSQDSKIPILKAYVHQKALHSFYITSSIFY